MIRDGRRTLPTGGSAPATLGFNAVAPEWLLSYGAAAAAPAIPAAESTIGSHPCVALSSAQVLPEWSNRNLAGKTVAANGDNPLNFVSHPRGSLQSDGSKEVNFYGIGGQKLVTVACANGMDGWQCSAGKTNVYFGGKLIALNGVYVATDRLGSVRANGYGERMSYYPYGEEKTSTTDGREKFGTYFRDSGTQDYADQRYYGVGTGRFNTPDPIGLAGADASDSTSSNLYAYVNGDPMNFGDPTGLDPNCGPNGTWMGEGCYEYGVSGTTVVPMPGAYNPYGVGPTGQMTNTTSMIGTISAEQLSGYLEYLYELQLAPAPTTTIEAILKSIGAILSGAVGAILTAVLNPTPMGNGSFPSVEWVEANCKPVGPPVIVPSTNYPGGESIEQEYLCPDGATYAVHTLTRKSGRQRERHLRPGRPKYGPKVGPV